MRRSNVNAAPRNWGPKKYDSFNATFMRNGYWYLDFIKGAISFFSLGM